MKLNSKYISNNLIFILILCLLIALLLPLLIVARFNVPSADDFSFSCETHAAVLDGKGISGLIKGAFYKVQDVYISWQGTFSAIFLMALQPSIWGFQYYSLTTWIMLVSLISGIFFLSFRIFNGSFQISKSISGIIASIISIICTQFLPMPNQSFYWYNGSVYYTFTFGIMLIMYAVYTGFFLYGSLWRIVVLCLLSVLIGGSNYVTALLSSIISLSITFYVLLRKDKRWISTLFPLLFLSLSFFISISAPGNAARQSTNPVHPSAIEAVILSFQYAVKNAISWADLRLLSCLVMILPFLWQGASSCKKVFRYPLIVTGFSFCLYSAAFTPHIYALGSDGPDRLKNIVYFFFILLIIFNMFWWFGWISHKKETRAKNNSDFTSLIILSGFSAGACICLLCAVVFFHTPLTSILAVNELKTGEAKAYYEEALQRKIILEDASISDCEFETFHNIPYLLYFTDMTDDPSDFQNEDTCTYYNKSSIIVR